MSPLNSRSQEYHLLQKCGIPILGHTNGFDEDTVKEIFGNRSRVNRIITRDFFPSAHMEGDWAHGGESWYLVASISTGLLSTPIPVAMKAIETLGDCCDRALTEAARLVKLAPNAAKVYAIAPCTIVKQWLVQDPPSKNDERLWRELADVMGQLGLSLLDSHLQSAAIISGGRAKVFDAGYDMFSRS